ncbi:MAG: response regulator transcription factor [Solirubrobacterales bacterium]
MSEQPTQISIVLADDHVVVRRGLRMLLDRVPEFEVVAEAGDAGAVLAAVQSLRPDLLLLDLNMPGAPLEALAELVDSSPSVAVVALTMEQDPGVAHKVLAAGAKGYVLKRAAEEELIEAIEAVAAGGTHVTPELAAAMRKQDTVEGPPDDLTEREAEVLRLIARGHTNAEVACELSLSVRTVETHRMRILQKLRLSSRAELVGYALEHRLMD